MLRPPASRAGETLNRCSSATTSGKWALVDPQQGMWHAPAGRGSRCAPGPALAIGGSSQRGTARHHRSDLPSRQRLACGTAWQQSECPWQLCGSNGATRQTYRSSSRRVTVCSLANTLAPLYSWGSSLTEPLARVLVPSSVLVAPSQQPPLPGSLGDACLGEGPNLSGLLLDHVTFMRCVGYAVLLGACFRSIPQILRIVRAKSARGVSLSANIAELLAYSITVAYNLRLGYPFSTYGEVVACWLQDIVLIAIIGRYTDVESWRMLGGSALFGLLCWWLTSRFCSTSTLRLLQVSTIAIIALGGRLPQILLNMRRGGTGELSLTTCLLNFVGNVTRIFTTLVLTQDRLIVAGNVIQGTANSVLLWQTASTAASSAGAVSKQQGRLSADDDDEPIGVSPAAIEAAESDAEEGTATAGDAGAAAAAAMGGDGGAAMGGDGGYGGLGSALFEPSPVDMPLDSGERRFD